MPDTIKTQKRQYANIKPNKVDFSHKNMFIRLLSNGKKTSYRMHEQYEPTDIKILKFIYTWKNLRSDPKC